MSIISGIINIVAYSSTWLTHTFNRKKGNYRRLNSIDPIQMNFKSK